MMTEEIFLDPNVRKYFRELFLGSKNVPSRASFSIKPTDKGLKKIDETHPYYVPPTHLTPTNHSTSNTSSTNASVTSRPTQTVSCKSWLPKQTA
jgi:hypothetical protein